MNSCVDALINSCVYALIVAASTTSERQELPPPKPQPSLSKGMTLMAGDLPRSGTSKLEHLTKKLVNANKNHEE